MTDIHPISFTKIPTLTELKAGFPGISALFFDMDGTLFNTEPHHSEAFIKIGRDHEIRPPHSKEVIHQMLVGKADYLVFDIVKEWPGFPKHWTVADFVSEKNKNLLTILETTNPDDYFAPGTKLLLQEARDQGFFLALVTSSEKVITKKLLDLAGLTGFFELELTRDDCPRHKPDPWPYHEARRRCGREKHEVLIFEDSQVGLSAATASGAHVIKVEWH